MPDKPTIIKVSASGALTTDRLKITNLTDTSLDPVTIQFGAAAQATYDLLNMGVTTGDTILLEVFGKSVGTANFTATAGTNQAKTISVTAVSSTNCPSISL